MLDANWLNALKFPTKVIAGLFIASIILLHLINRDRPRFPRGAAVPVTRMRKTWSVPGYLAGVSLLVVTFSASAGPKEIQYKMFYQAPETNNEWVFMLEQKNLSPTKLKPSDLPKIQQRAKRSANRYCKPDARWWDTRDKSGPGLWADVSLAEYVKIPLAKKQPDRIKLVYFSGNEDIVECETSTEPKSSKKSGGFGN